MGFNSNQGLLQWLDLGLLLLLQWLDQVDLLRYRNLAGFHQIFQEEDPLLHLLVSHRLDLDHRLGHWLVVGRHFSSLVVVRHFLSLVVFQLQVHQEV